MKEVDYEKWQNWDAAFDGRRCCELCTLIFFVRPLKKSENMKLYEQEEAGK